MLGDKDEEKIKLWFTRKEHHRNASVVYITQNLFQQSKSSRTISLNAHYLVLFQSPRDKMQIKVLAKVSNGAKIRNRYNQVPHLTQDTNGKVTNSQKTPQTRAKRSALSQQVTTKHI